MATATSTQAITVNAPSPGAILAIIVAMLGLMASAFNSGSEIAFFSLSHNDVDGIDDERKRDRLKTLLANPEKLLATILIGNNLVNIMIIVVLNYAMNQIFTFHSAVANFVVQTVILTFLILLFGEVLPKLYATDNNVKFALLAAPVLQVLERVFSPLSGLMLKSTHIVNKTVTKRSDDISMEDLSVALENSDVKSADDKDLLEGILKFGDKTVNEIMTPRIDIVDLSADATFDEVVKVVVEHGYSRMPVYGESPDDIKGILYAKDLLPFIGKRDNSFNWLSLLRPVYYVPETRMIDDLLEDFRKKKTHMAVVVDEFGCTQGIATMEDVLEEIVGDIDDEYDTEEKFYTRIDDDTFMFDGKTALDDFFEVTGLDPRTFKDVTTDAETLAGLLLGIKGEFLDEKETLSYGGCEFTATKLKKYRIARVRVHISERPSREE